MGLGSLFGFGGYNQKTFEKNTRIFTDKIQDMIRRCSGNYGVGATLNQVARALARNQYQADKNPAEMEAIDNRILKLLDQMMGDIQQGKNAKLSAHATMMLDAIQGSREYGKEVCSEHELAVNERLAELFAAMEDVVEQKAALKAEMDKIERDSQNLSEDDPRFDILDSKYAQCEERMQSLDERFQELREEYAVQGREAEVMADDKFYDEIPADVTSPAQLESIISRVAEKRSKRKYVRSTKTDKMDEYKKDKIADLSTGSAASTSGLRARREAANAASVSGAIDGASAPRSGLRAKRDNG